MIPSAFIFPALSMCGWSVWTRRRTWRGMEWDRAITLSVLCQGLGFFLCAPFESRFLGHAMFALTGVAHLRDFFGHVFFVCAACFVIYAAAGRVVPDHKMEPLLKKIELPSALAAGTMLACITLTHSPGNDIPDFLDVPCDGWLKVYWITYGLAVAYLLRLLLVLMFLLRRDPRSRAAANLFIAATLVGMVAITALVTKVVAPLHITDYWIWAPLCASGGIAAYAAATSWRGRMRPFRIRPGTEGGPPKPPRPVTPPAAPRPS